MTTAEHHTSGAAAERRLARLALDLHDGPLQELAALAADLRLLRAQAATAPAEILEGRIDDALGLLGSIESDVRELARTLESKKLVRVPLAELVRSAAEEAEVDGVAVSVRVLGDVDSCTPSQRIALYRVVQESLWNVRHHSGADSASVDVTAGEESIAAEITDRGRGFDVEAARGMGIAGMRERVRMLGGELEVASRIGGPTRVRATIPRWRPE